MKLKDLVEDLMEVVSPLRSSAYGGLVVLRHVLMKVERILRDEESRDDDFRGAAEELLKEAEGLIVGNDAPYDLQGLIDVLHHLETHIETCRDERKTLKQNPPDRDFGEQIRRFLADLRQALE
jgi:hypothetical protein